MVSLNFYSNHTKNNNWTPNLTITGAFFSIQFNFLYSTINFISAPSVSIRSAIVLTTTSGTFGLSSFKVRYIFFLFLRGCCCYCCFYIILFYLFIIFFIPYIFFKVTCTTGVTHVCLYVRKKKTSGIRKKYK